MGDFKANDAREVVNAATLLRVSEFEVFRLAYREWFGRLATNKEIDVTFARYLGQSAVPVWVRNFTRKINQLNDEGHLDAREFGIQPPPPSSPQMVAVGSIALVAIVTIVTLLIYLAIQAEDLRALKCQFPPCY